MSDDLEAILAEGRAADAAMVREFAREDRVREFLAYDGPDKVIPTERLREMAAGRPRQLPVRTGFPTLDLNTGGGFIRGEMIVISGPTKHGKSTLALTLTRNLSFQNQQSVWFSFEMPQEVLFVERYPGIACFVPLELRANSVDWVKTRMEEARDKWGCRYAFIDHLHFIVDMARMKNSSIEIGSIVRQLKRAAIDLGMVVFLIAHIGKEDKLAPDRLSESDVRDSSFIPQEADSTIMVSRWFRDNDLKRIYRSDDKARVTVCNHRRTGAFDKSFIVEKEGDFVKESEIWRHDNNGMVEDHTMRQEAERAPF